MVAITTSITHTPANCERAATGGLKVSLLILIIFICFCMFYSTRLCRSTRTVHSQRHRQGTADHVNPEEGPEEMAAAKSQHFLYECMRFLQNQSFYAIRK